MALASVVRLYFACVLSLCVFRVRMAVLSVVVGGLRLPWATSPCLSWQSFLSLTEMHLLMQATASEGGVYLSTSGLEGNPL